jgi:hypothetical protein
MTMKPVMSSASRESSTPLIGGIGGLSVAANLLPAGS